MIFINVISFSFLIGCAQLPDSWPISEADANETLQFPLWLEELGAAYWGRQQWSMDKRVYTTLKPCAIAPSGVVGWLPRYCPNYGDLLDFVLRNAQPNLPPPYVKSLRMGVAIEPYKVTSLELDTGIVEIIAR
eukprot:Gregarina_sp_Poly_1__10824@NODE_836_length_6052_cov_95_155221_g604_i0_p6_GENE_NODE_836_length_6052_cov_95_155221_g604_i0NODE_836_length_6052_cov_95_155221_g604_i0_p6_ORF_typecomplete_len133_score14_49_NODE_836_length_6052_cov_95_155221_g604_i034263824